MADPLHDAGLKIKRANEHINHLDNRWRAFVASSHYDIHVEHDANAGCDLIKLESAQAVPDDFLPIIGDALHNLRASLDYAMHVLVQGPTKYTRFPIHETRHGLEGALNGGMKERTSDVVRNTILTTIQPYAGGNGDLLWHLHQLDIEDKHRLLIAQTQVTDVKNIRAVDEKGAEFVIPGWLIIAPYVASHRCEGHSNIKITDKGDASSGIVFGNGMPMQGHLILPSLREMYAKVNSTLGLLGVVMRRYNL